jgi:hypothetical protein
MAKGERLRVALILAIVRSLTIEYGLYVKRDARRLQMQSQLQIALIQGTLWSSY